MSASDVRSVLAASVRADLVTFVMLLLVLGIGLVIARYSRRYLSGDPGLARYFRWLSVTLGAVVGLVVAKNLLVIAVAWFATSLALHQLLTFYPGRLPALVAAHKKFLVSRLADAALVVSLGLVEVNVGSLDLDRIDAWVAVHPGLTPSMQAAAVLVVLAVALRSAQLPFHGWLMQVMEAPTPVSALLHAGVVNIGGFVLIRLGPWLGHAPAARLVLVVIGLVTAVVAALVTTTRVSVKVALAWSTCAQMGFMLLECGLGAWHLALLHLVAHSLYKAHAFLAAGGAVARWRALSAASPPPRPRAIRGVLVLLAALGAAGALAMSSRDASVAALGFVAVLSLGPILLRPGGARSAFGAALLYAGLHLGAARLLPSAPVVPALWLVAGAGLVALFVVKSVLESRPDGRLARALYPWLFAGLYLDELFTRIAFRVWPPRLPGPEPRPARPLVRDAVEA